MVKEIRHKESIDHSPGYSTVSKIQNQKFRLPLHYLKMDFLSKKYAPMNRAHIPGFPNRLPRIDWQAYLPKFREEKGEDVSIDLIRFHLHIHRLRVDFPEDCLMNMFMVTVTEKKSTLTWKEELIG